MAFAPAASSRAGPPAWALGTGAEVTSMAFKYQPWCTVLASFRWALVSRSAEEMIPPASVCLRGPLQGSPRASGTWQVRRASYYLSLLFLMVTVRVGSCA